MNDWCNETICETKQISQWSFWWKETIGESNEWNDDANKLAEWHRWSNEVYNLECDDCFIGFKRRVFQTCNSLVLSDTIKFN